MSRRETIERIERLGLVPVVRAPSAAVALRAARAVHAGGIDVLEITMTVPDALDVLRQLAAELKDRVILGAGTVLDADTARACIAAGARVHRGPRARPRDGPRGARPRNAGDAGRAHADRGPDGVEGRRRHGQDLPLLGRGGGRVRSRAQGAAAPGEAAADRRRRPTHGSRLHPRRRRRARDSAPRSSTSRSCSNRATRRCRLAPASSSRSCAPRARSSQDGRSAWGFVSVSLACWLRLASCRHALAEPALLIVPGVPARGPGRASRPGRCAGRERETSGRSRRPSTLYPLTGLATGSSSCETAPTGKRSSSRRAGWRSSGRTANGRASSSPSCAPSGARRIRTTGARPSSTWVRASMDLVLANLTINNDYGSHGGSHDHQFAVRSGKGTTRISVLHANVLARRWRHDLAVEQRLGDVLPRRLDVRGLRGLLLPARVELRHGLPFRQPQRRAPASGTTAAPLRTRSS